MPIKLPSRNYLTFAELCERWQCSENDIRELIIEEQIKPSLFLGGLGGYFVNFKYDEATFGTRTINKLRFEPGDTSTFNRDLFYLREPRRTAALDCDFSFCSWSSSSKRTESDEREELTSSTEIEWCQLDKSIALDEALSNGVFDNIEIARFEAKINHRSEKLLSTLERKSLLTIIAALCTAAGIDYEARGAATQIAVLTTRICSGLESDTVLKAIKAIPDALELRQR